jgi:hypothetical protein
MNYSMFLMLPLELGIELELIQTQMTQKPMLRADSHARALRAGKNRKEDRIQRALREQEA